MLPGFVDLQVNGFGGVDFNAPALRPEDLERALDRMQATGVTRCLPTVITSSLEAFAARAAVIARSGHPAIAGLHMEGPYISPDDGPRGAHPRAHIRPASIDDYRRRQEAAEGRIVLVTLAPEVPGALPLIDHLVAAGVRVAIGHTAATPAQLAAAISAGASLATHLGNGCAALLPRHPNGIWELLAADEVLATLIVDGHHLPPATVKSMVRAKGVHRTVLITDAIAAAGAAPGRYRLGDVEAELGADGRVSLPGTPYLAGSSLTMDRAVGNTARFAALPLDLVIPMASTIPAAFIGLEPRGTVTADWDPAGCKLSVKTVTTTEQNADTR
jgi:N-acetylglucosamine-6-phosphate deacetylase